MTTSLPRLGATLALAFAAALTVTPAAQAADVGVSISVGQPGFYGRIDVGPVAPSVIYAQPMVIRPIARPPAPIYLRVPPGHYRNWSKHCARYDACGTPVYFVREDWYEHRYGADWRREDRDGPPRGHGRGHGHGHGRDRD